MERLSSPSRCVLLEGLSSLSQEPTVHALVADYGSVEVRMRERKGSKAAVCYLEFDSIDYSDRARSIGYAASAVPSILLDASPASPAALPKAVMRERCPCYSALTLQPVGLNGSGAESDAPVLMVKGLSESTTEGDLLDAFSPFGQVKEVRLVRDRTTKATRGFSFVEFHDLESAKVRLPPAPPIGLAKATLRAPPIVIHGATARVSWARETSRGGASDRRDLPSAAVDVSQVGG
ncbi:MAG: hypothetical protein SGPRY_011188 [Prymnesium sp.]